MAESFETGTEQIRQWRSIVTLIVFVVTNIIVLFPFHLPIPFPQAWRNAISMALRKARIIDPRPKPKLDQHDRGFVLPVVKTKMIYLRFPLNPVTAPLIADLFLLAIIAIGRQEVHDGTVGSNNILPIDIMVFFLTLAYIAISIDASGLIRWLAFKVLQKAGHGGRRLYFYLYLFFFGLSSFIGNDPIVLSGTAFLSYMTRVSTNIKHPRAWIYMQFACANIGSAILVSSNPTNLVLSGAFQIKFIVYTANIIVPVIVTAVVLFPFLLWVIFNDDELIPPEINIHQLADVSDTQERKAPTNPNIPYSGGTAEEKKLEEVLNPFLDKKGAGFGALIMAVTLITILVLNASSASGQEHPVFYVTLPAAFIVFCWDVISGWFGREETRPVAERGRYITLAINEEMEQKKLKEQQQKKEEGRQEDTCEASSAELSEIPPPSVTGTDFEQKNGESAVVGSVATRISQTDSSSSEQVSTGTLTAKQIDDQRESRGKEILAESRRRPTLELYISDAFWWFQGTFPTVAAVMTHLPWALIPFALCMFVLVQALVTKGWVPVFAHGWDHWVSKTGVIGAIGGMGFLSVVLCNFAGTNIGTTILLCRVIQTWIQIHENNQDRIDERTFWSTVYSMAIGVNYGAFSTAFSASLAGLLWRDILMRKEIRVRSLDFIWVNLPIIAICMTVGLVVLIGEVYLTRSGTKLYVPNWLITSV